MLQVHALRPHVLGTKGAFLSGRWSAERSWPFSSGVLQQGAHIPEAAPLGGEALRTRDPFLAALTLFPRWVGGPSQSGCCFVRFAGPSFRLCPDVAHGYLQTGCRWDFRAPVPGKAEGTVGFAGMWAWAAPGCLHHGGAGEPLEG